MFPGYSYNRRFMESMMGVKSSLALDEEPTPIGFWRRWLVEFPALIRLLIRSGVNFLRIRTIIRRFEEHFARHHDQWVQIDYDRLPPHELARMYHRMEREMLWNWRVPIINDFFVMVFYGMLRKMCVSWCGDENASLQNGLLCGEGGLTSDEPAKMVLQMTQLVRRRPELEELVLHQPLETLPQRIGSDTRFPEFNALMTRYLRDFGLRCANELKLESYSYRDQPHRVYQWIRDYLAFQDLRSFEPGAAERREQQARKAAEQEAHQKLIASGSGPLRRMLFRWVLQNVRLGVRNRENMRFARTRIYGILRQMVRAIGQQFADQGILDQREDVFYLTLDEVWSYIHGTAMTTNLTALARLRKEEFELSRQQAAPPDRFETCGLPYWGNRPQDVWLKMPCRVELLSGRNLSAIQTTRSICKSP